MSVEDVSSKLLYLRLILNISEQCQGLPVQQEKEVGQIHTPQRQTWFQQKHLEIDKDGKHIHVIKAKAEDVL